MSGVTLGGQVTVQNPANPSVKEFYTHPDFRVIAAFFLGWVFLYSLCHAVRSSLLRQLIRRGARLCKLKSTNTCTSDIEAPEPEEKGRGHVDDSALIQQEVNDTALIFIMNLCFAFTSFAQFCSLLNMGTQHEDTIVCTFVIAWGSMASQSVRMTGLLMLSWRLRRLGVRRSESFLLWIGLLIVLGLVFALNATGTGNTMNLGSTGLSICYRQYYLPLSLSLSATLISLELYVLVRLLSLGLSHSSRLHDFFGNLLNVDVARATSLLILDALTIVPAAMWVNTLAEYIPFSIGALVVIGAFNCPECVNAAVRCQDQSLRNDSIINIQRMSNIGPESVLTPDPFLLHLLDSPEPYRSPEEALGLPTTRIGVKETPRQSLVEEDVVDPPLGAPANLDYQAQPLDLRSRQILPFQVKYAERFERGSALPTGPVVRPIRQRPQIFVVIQDEQAIVKPRFSRSTIIGSDIIRITPSPSRRKRKDSRVLSLESTAPSAYHRSSSHDSTTAPMSVVRNSMSTFSTYTHLKHSSSGETPSDGRYLNRRGSVQSPDSTPGYASRFLSHQLYASARTPAREELLTADEGGQGLQLTPSYSRVRSRRQTFGQALGSGRQEITLSSCRESLPTIFIPPPALSRPSPNSREAALPAVSRLPLIAQIPSPVASPYGAGRGTGLLIGTGSLRGPRPPPIAIPSPRMVACQTTTSTADDVVADAG